MKNIIIIVSCLVLISLGYFFYQLRPVGKQLTEKISFENYDLFYSNETGENSEKSFYIYTNDKSGDSYSVTKNVYAYNFREEKISKEICNVKNDTSEKKVIFDVCSNGNKIQTLIFDGETREIK